MNINFNNDKFKKVSIVVGSVFVVLYAVFLILPFVLSPIANSYCQHVEDLIKTSTGFDAEMDGLGIITSPNLSAGIKVKDFSLSVPTSEKPFLKAENFRIRLALLPLLIKKVQIDKVSASSVDANLVVKKDGSFLVEDYLVQKNNPESEPMTSLPFGLHLSNHLPNVNVKTYKIAFVDAIDSNEYAVDGEKFKISDFVLDKKIKFSTKGNVILDNRAVSNYDLNIYNRIMPDIQLEDLVFPKKVVLDSEVQKNKDVQSLPFNIIEIFKSINKNELTADISAKIKVSGCIKNPNIKGSLNLNAMSVAVNGNKLPESYANLVFSGNKTDIDSIFFSSVDENEKTQIIGNFHTGKKPAVDLTLRSNAQFNNIIRFVDSIAQSFEIEDFKTLSAKGGIDADFNINSDMKKVSSTGYLRVKPSKISYGLYNLSIDNIIADIDLMNNNINIKKAGFSILSHPLSLTGTIEPDSTTNLKLYADKLSVKGLIAALGQIALLKENDFNSGTLSFNALIKGKLNELKPSVNANVTGLDVLNKPSGAKLILSRAFVKLAAERKSLNGNVDISSLIFKHPTIEISVPSTKIVMDSKDIKVKNSYLLFNNSRIDIKGSITDYLTDKLNINLSANGKLRAVDIVSVIPYDMRKMFPAAGSLPLKITVNGNTKTQNISVNIAADKNNYVTFADINLLKNKPTNVNANMKISADSLTFSNSGIYSGAKQIVSLAGSISHLYSEPKLNLDISVPNDISFPIWGMGNSNITARGAVSVYGQMFEPKLKGVVNVADVSIKDIAFAITNLTAHLNGSILNGTATADEFKSGGIVAHDISSKFALTDYNDFYLSDLNARAFDGKIGGNISYSIADSSIGIDLTGTDLNSTDAIYGAVGIKNALTGILDFKAKLVMQGLTDKEIIRSMKGNINFNIDDGRFMGIGRLENLVAAQNVSSNSVLKAAISSLTTLSTIQEANKFDSINGDITLSSGNANITNINVAGPLMAYYVKGTYSIIPNTANIVILGRLDSKVVSCLGVLGDLSADKLLSYIPKFGAMTSKILKQLTADPSTENTALIPALTTGAKEYKDFKVLFNGPVESASSVKNFKWLSTCDTSSIDLSKDIQNAKDAVKTNINERVENAKTNAQNIKNNVNTIIETQKNRVENAKQEFEQTKQDIQQIKENSKQNSKNLKDLLNNAIKNSQKPVGTYQPADTTETQSVGE